MKYLTFIFLLLSFQSFAQITGNLHIKDSSAIQLDSTAVFSLLGKWKLMETVEFIRDEEQIRDRGIIVDFDTKGDIITSWCVGCHEENAGKWKVINEQTIKFNDNRAEENRYLAGEWAVYKLTDDEMILAKVLTSSGDWKKLHYLSRNIGNPPTTEANRYCINCTQDGLWCYGDRPEEAARQWIKLYEMINSDGDKHQNSGEILERIEWLLQNAPCISDYLYVQSAAYYESLLKVEKNMEARALYRDKLKQINEKHKLYFKR